MFKGRNYKIPEMYIVLKNLHKLRNIKCHWHCFTFKNLVAFVLIKKQAITFWWQLACLFHFLVPVELILHKCAFACNTIFVHVQDANLWHCNVTDSEPVITGDGKVNDDNEKKDDSGNETGAGEGEQEEEQQIFYDKTKSFFDNISCEAVERSKGWVFCTWCRATYQI